MNVRHMRATAILSADGLTRLNGDTAAGASITITTWVVGANYRDVSLGGGVGGRETTTSSGHIKRI